MAADNLHDSITSELGAFINSKSATFACGGSISIGIEHPLPADPFTGLTTYPSFSLRWDSPDAVGSVAKLTFPLGLLGQEQSDRIQMLVRDCQPAGFGYKGEDVLDQSYRRATKMDRPMFSVDFCPYESGIIDTITQLLLPNAGGATNGVKAELYKLNVYSAPSGFFKPYVDTPRSNYQFGSLVVAFPCPHEGGQLVVRHSNQSVTFDWSKSGSRARNSAAVQWAAFYSDCEHEVKEVTEGHRITLTYNLYYTRGIGELSGNSPAMDVTSLLLFHKVKAALESPTFMADGGALGIFCQHAYAHSTPEGIQAFPGVLKGTDMAIYSVLLSLGLEIEIRPVLNVKPEDEYDEYDEYNDTTCQDNRHDMNFIARQLKPIQISEVGGCEESQREIVEEYGGEWLKVNWLNQPQHKGIGYVHLTYGNQAGVGYKYTHAALVVSVPPAVRRHDQKDLD